MSFLQRRGNVLMWSALAGMLAVLLTVNTVHAAIFTWIGGLGPSGFENDLKIAANWVGGALPNTTTGEADFDDTGTSTSTVSTTYGGFQVLALKITGTNGHTFSGDGNMFIYNNGSIDTRTAAGDVTFSNAYLQLNRGGSLYARGSGNLIINPDLVLGAGGSSGTPSLNAIGGDITAYGLVNFELAGVDRVLDLKPSAGRTITLAGGFYNGTTRLTDVNARGEAGGKTILGASTNSTGWTGRVNIYTSDVEINNDNSLGEVGSTDYT